MEANKTRALLASQRGFCLVSVGERLEGQEFCGLPTLANAVQGCVNSADGTVRCRIYSPCIRSRTSYNGSGLAMHNSPASTAASPVASSEGLLTAW
jgi:hypothetical protein